MDAWASLDEGSPTQLDCFQERTVTGLEAAWHVALGGQIIRQDFQCRIAMLVCQLQYQASGDEMLRIILNNSNRLNVPTTRRGVLRCEATADTKLDAVFSLCGRWVVYYMSGPES